MNDTKVVPRIAYDFPPQEMVVTHAYYRALEEKYAEERSASSALSADISRLGEELASLRATPLYKHAALSGYMLVAAEDVLREIAHQAYMYRNENPKFSLRLTEAVDVFRAHMEAMQSNIDVTLATPAIPTGHRLVPYEWKKIGFIELSALARLMQGSKKAETLFVVGGGCQPQDVFVKFAASPSNAAPTGGG